MVVGDVKFALLDACILSKVSKRVLVVVAASATGSWFTSGIRRENSINACLQSFNELQYSNTAGAFTVRVTVGVLNAAASLVLKSISVTLTYVV